MPVVETRRTETRVFAGREALIVYLCAEEFYVGIGSHFPRVFVCIQESADEFVHTNWFGSPEFDRVVQWFRDSDACVYDALSPG